HRGALKAKRPTVAVLATGCDRIYPPENNTLASEILKHNGALVSELLPQTAPRRQNFAFRNRIISGLSLGVLVVEAPQDSGALLTASHALKQNREIFAIPARIVDISSLGTLRLIQQGAKLVLSPKDILEELPPFSALAETMLPVSSNLQQERLNGYDEEEKKVVEALSAGELDSSTIARLTKIPVQQVTAILLKLQLKGRVAALPGNRFELKTHH
ncbi:MAG: DNA-protecting protein DprA, partial [Planctomycetota bacterium]|nr:DNA-protecting protein DprA [Planctomycetota bacterium]